MGLIKAAIGQLVPRTQPTVHKGNSDTIHNRMTGIAAFVLYHIYEIRSSCALFGVLYMCGICGCGSVRRSILLFGVCMGFAICLTFYALFYLSRFSWELRGLGKLPVCFLLYLEGLVCGRSWQRR
jgi:hypothetical protein